MPVTSFVMGAEGWTPVDHKLDESHRSRRMLPMGDIHALDPEDSVAQCTKAAMAPDPRQRSFIPWGAGTCANCSEALAPRAAQGTT